MAFEFKSICPECRATNRIPAVHLTHQGRCGACKARLTAVAEALEVNQAEFDEIIDSSSIPVLVDFWASWCQPCKAIAPEIRKLAREMGGRGLVIKVDTDASPLLPQRFGVQSIPNVMIFQGGVPVFSRPGFARSDEMQAWMEDFIASARVSCGA